VTDGYLTIDRNQQAYPKGDFAPSFGTKGRKRQGSARPRPARALRLRLGTATRSAMKTSAT